MHKSNSIKATFILSFYVVLFLSGCTAENTTESIDADSSSYISEFRSYKIDLEAPKKDFSELIDRVNIIRLEETEESLIGNIYNVQVHEDVIGIPSTGNDLIYFFNRKGDFIRSFERKGDGPEEYSSLWYYWLEKGNIQVFDNPNGEIITYNQNAEYITSQKIPIMTFHIFKENNNYWLDRGTRGEDTVNHEVVRLDENMENPSYYLPYEGSYGVPITTTINSFRKAGDVLTYKHILKDTIYKVDEAGLEPLVHLDFGSDYLWSDPEMRSNSQKAMKGIQEGAGKVWIFNPWMNDQYIYFNYSTSFDQGGMMLLDRASGEMVNIDTNKNPEEKYALMFNSWLKDQMLVGISSLDLSLLLDELDPSQYDFEEGSTLEEIESSENPALMWVTFKEGF